MDTPGAPLVSGSSPPLWSDRNEGGPRDHGGRRHVEIAAETYSGKVLLRHLQEQHRESGIALRDGRPALVELHDILHGVQLSLDLG